MPIVNNIRNCGKQAVLARDLPAVRKESLIPSPANDKSGVFSRLTLSARIRTFDINLTGKPVEEIMTSEKEKKWLDDEVGKLYRNMPRKGHMANFFHCIKTGELPISGVFTHLNALNSCHMANIAMMLKRKVKWDPEKYEFIGDDEANMLTRRIQREPYAIKV